MTPEHVIHLADARAREFGERWTVDNHRIITTTRKWCPIEVAAGEPRLPNAYDTLGLDLGVASAVWTAADDDEDTAPLRALMLATFDFGGEVSE